MAQRFYVLLNNGIIQPFEFDKTQSGQAAIKIEKEIVPDIAKWGLTLCSFKVAEADKKFVGIANPTSGGSCTAFLFNLAGKVQRQVTMNGAFGRGIVLTPQRIAWITSSTGVFMWPINGTEFCAVSPQSARSVDATVCRPCSNRSNLLYGARHKLVVHDVQDGERYSMSSRILDLSQTAPNGDDRDLVVYGIHKVGTEVLVLWTSNGAVGGNPNQFLTAVRAYKFDDLIKKAKGGTEELKISVDLERDGQSWGVWASDPSQEIILAGRGRGQFRRFEWVPDPQDPKWKLTHDLKLDDYLSPSMRSSEIKFIDDGQLA